MPNRHVTFSSGRTRDAYSRSPSPPPRRSSRYQETSRRSTRNRPVEESEDEAPTRRLRTSRRSPEPEEIEDSYRAEEQLLRPPPRSTHLTSPATSLGKRRSKEQLTPPSAQPQAPVRAPVLLITDEEEERGAQQPQKRVVTHIQTSI